jgi:hypothetical protein
MPLRDEIHRHLCNLMQLGVRDQLTYLWARIEGKIAKRTAAANKLLKRGLWALCIATGRSLPHSVRSPYILNVYSEALKNFTPKPYSGRVILFLGEDASRESKLEWMKRITGELEIHELRGDHLELRTEPYVRLWAEKLKASLDKAQLSASTLISGAEKNTM